MLSKKCAFLFCLLFLSSFAALSESWRIILNPAHQNDEAMKAALSDLQEYGAKMDLTFTVEEDAAADTGGNLILVGDPAQNRVTAGLASVLSPTPDPVTHPEGYAIRTVAEGGRRIVLVSGASVLGEVYGLYWIWDRMRVFHSIPDINTDRAPAMKIRMGAAWGRGGMGSESKKIMRHALRHSFNWLSGPAILDLVPWNAEPEATENAKNREAVRELIAYAHGLHMKYFSFANEFTFHPSLLADTGATLSPDDPKLWDAIQEKYRMLFRALPELDGVEICNDDISGFWDNYQPFDVTRDAPECDWSYVKRFNTFVSKVHEVVAGEFGKTYFHFTWGLREHEVHCQPEVFRGIFNESIPTDNLYLVPKITRGDRWWFQPYNATFNQTPHETVVLYETMNYYESGASHIFPTFAGDYYQRGLQTFLAPENSNLRGMAALAAVDNDDWGTRGAYSYVLYRLMWNPNDSMDQIARDFCSIHFGSAAADGMARIYQLTAAAYQYGLHIEPISYGQFNSFLHMRVGTFPADGYPAIDQGKEHLKFLRTIYLRCAPWREQTMNSLKQGLAAANEMIALYPPVQSKISSQELAEDLKNRLNMTRNLIRVNMGYVDLIFAYFDFEENPSPEKKKALAQAYERCTAARSDFVNTPRYSYDLFGVDTLLKNASATLEDPERAREQLARIPDRPEIEAIIAAQQQRYREVLEARKDQALRLARFEVLIDGQDMLSLQDKEYRIVTIRWDGAQVKVGDLFAALPKQSGTVVIQDIESRPLHPFVLEQPSEENGFTVKIYLDDQPGANGWMRFELYWIPETPAALGLQAPWAMPDRAMEK